MATAFTHAFVGAALAIGAPRGMKVRRLALLLAVLAALPDLDALAFQLGFPYHHPLGHRGFTHSFAFAIALGAVGASTLRPWLGARTWLAPFVLITLATASHGVIDAFTDAGLGIGLLLPFDDARYFAPFRPLATSPLGVRAFFAGPALRILANELIWVGLPVAALVASVQLFRAHRPRR